MKTYCYFLIVLCLINGCSTQSYFTVNVNSYGNGDFQNRKTYLLVPLDSTVSINGFEFQEYSVYIKRVLAKQGYYSVNNADSANVVIFMDYGISDPMTYPMLVSKPVWGRTGVASSTTSGTVKVDPYSNTANYSQKTTNQYNWGVAGQKTETELHTEYFRYLNLFAYDYDYFKETQKERALWQTEVTSTGGSNDMRQVFPVMVAASVDYFGRNSGRKIQTKITENDTRVRMVKGMYQIDNQTQTNKKNTSVILTEEEKIISDLRKSKEVKVETYKSISDVKIGDYIRFKSHYNEIVYGRVADIISKRKVKVKLFPSPGTTIFDEIYFSAMEKIIQ